MTKLTRDTLFKPTLSRTESKAEAVSRIAMSMIEQEVAVREAKTERLRQARLAQEAVDTPPVTTRRIAKSAAEPAAKATKSVKTASKAPRTAAKSK
ncbi:hypothetical protein [Ancylobacter radicis]|uniref:Transcriptional regulator n=1 Tax=Ancylobacter radicis TaxID=2836179 RepID=A0ABS5RCL4_9HYPH|nr:hypothetical protein [Ancylobacter radicis]MBS9479060.1 hypothetical protein [Ancylobacter radicis]